MKSEPRPPQTLADLGEEGLVANLIKSLPSNERVLVGAGDDCAVVDLGLPELQLLKTDAIIEGVHYLSETDARRVGRKAVGRVLSDFAAMGGAGRELLVTIASPASREVSWVKSLYEGLCSSAEAGGCAIVGGETVGLPEGAPAMISIAGTGAVRREALRLRCGGEAGQLIWVTGVLGGSFESGHHLDFSPRGEEGQWIGANAPKGAMMDLSDGLQRDLPRLADASGCGFELWPENLPCREGSSVEAALCDGEDMELLFTADDGDWAEEFRSRFPKTRLTAIGKLAESSLSYLGQDGWQHFKGGAKHG